MATTKKSKTEKRKTLNQLLSERVTKLEDAGMDLVAIESRLSRIDTKLDGIQKRIGIVEAAQKTSPVITDVVSNLLSRIEELEEEDSTIEQAFIRIVGLEQELKSLKSGRRWWQR